MNGIIYVIDGRNKNPLGAVLPEDIIGAFEVRGGMFTQRPIVLIPIIVC